MGPCASVRPDGPSSNPADPSLSKGCIWFPDVEREKKNSASTDSA